MPKFLPTLEYPYITKRIRRLESHHFSGPAFRYPLNCEDVRIACSVCGANYAPPWTEPLAGELVPFLLDTDKTGAYVPAGVKTKCPECGAENPFSFPHEPEKTKSLFITLFGDEASQNYAKNSFMYVYVFYSGNGSLRRSVIDLLNETKSKIRPDVAPTSWVLHAYEIRETRWRNKNRVKLSIEEINQSLIALCDVIASSVADRVISATVYPAFKNDRSLKQIRAEVIQVALFVSTDLVARAGFNLAHILEGDYPLDTRMS